FFFQAEDGIRDKLVTGVQTCALPISKVRVNCVCPGVIETPMTAPLLADAAWRESAVRRHPLGRVGQPEEIAAAILYLASDEAAFVTGVALPVDGGYTAA